MLREWHMAMTVVCTRRDCYTLRGEQKRDMVLRRKKLPFTSSQSFAEGRKHFLKWFLKGNTMALCSDSSSLIKSIFEYKKEKH
jgi:hypothetical protein